jgi:two-component system cell cycle sensor histidine kinase/response regulator CckA
LLEGLVETWSDTSASERGPAENQRNVTMAIRLAMAVFVWMGTVQLIVDSPLVGWSGVAAALSCLGLSLFLKATGRSLAAAHVLTSICFGFVAVVAVASGGTAIGALFFLGLVPVVAIQTIGLRAAAGWTILCVALLLAVSWQRTTGVSPLFELDPGATGASPNRAAIIFILVLFLFLSTSDVARKRAQGRVRTSERERQRLDQALIEESRRYRALVENSRDLIVELDESGRIQYASDNGAEVLGVKVLVGTTLVERIWPSDRRGQADLFERLLMDDEFLVSPPVRYRGAGDEWRWLEAVGRRYRYANGEFRVVVRLRNVTADLEFQRRLQQTQKLQAVGQLAGGVAHDFNNLLTVVVGCADEIVEDPEFAIEGATEILRIAERAAGLTRQLLAFTRESAYAPRVVDLSALVHGLEEMLKRLLGEQTQLCFHLADGLPNVEVDPMLVEQAVVNLVVNARDASPSGALVEVRVGLLPSESDPGTGVVFVEVSDTGTGMSPEVAERAFEPFFTTKGVESGTGLGLALVHGAVEQMGGTAHLETTEGKGTTVSIRFPSVPPLDGSLPAAALDGQDGKAERSARGGTVLVVEDERAIRDLVRSHLVSAGFEVSVAEDGEAGLALAQKAERPFDLLVSDVVMPNLSGPAMMRRLRVAHPQAKVLFISGYPATHLGEEPDPGDPLIQKPFRRRELLSRVQALIDGAGDSSTV